MSKRALSFAQPHFYRRAASGRGFLYGAVFAAALLLGACADVKLEIENQQAAQELARLSKPLGSVYTGWRVFQDRCAACHGPDASGSALAPDLLPLVEQMGPRRFLGLVLQRYDWNLSPPQSGRSEPTPAAIDQVMQRKEPALTMPAWQGSPSVSAHIADLYAYLAARAEGTQGKESPQP